MRKIQIKFEGIDDWSRPVYKSKLTKSRYGSVNILFPDKEIAPNNSVEEINDYFKRNMYQLDYFGSSFNCEPMGSNIPEGFELEIVG